MSEVWKSTPRKYCDFCKCWLADNKISISIHENGKGHKENVERKIRTSQKAGIQKAKDEAKAKKLFAIMEKNALKAYNNKDLGLEAGSADSISSQGNKRSHSGKQEFGGKYAKTESVLSSEAKPEWYEFKSNSGQSYFVNLKTNESQWNRPESGKVVALHDNVQIADETTKSDSIKTEKREGFYSSGPLDELYQRGNKVNVKEESKDSLGHAKTGREVAYGAFKPLQSKQPDVPVNLGLPEQTDNSHLFAHLPSEAFSEVDEDNKLVIGVKQVNSVGYGYDDDVEDFRESKSNAGCSSLFKKRKFGFSKARNIRGQDSWNLWGKYLGDALKILNYDEDGKYLEDTPTLRCQHALDVLLKIYQGSRKVFLRAFFAHFVLEMLLLITKKTQPQRELCWSCETIW